MNSSGNDNWHPGGPQHPGMDQMNQQPRPLGSFSQNPPQQGPSAQQAGPVLPPPSGPYHPASQPSSHSLPGLAELSQSHGGPHQPPAYGQHPSAPSHSAGHSLPGIGQAMQHPSPQSINRERERDSRERELIERQRQEEMVHREREQREREQLERQQMERQQREQQHHPVQSHTGSIPLHQPVASKVPNSIHGPNGLLSNLGSNPPPGGPGALYGPQMPHGEGTPRSYMQHPGGPPGQPMMGFNGSGPPIPGNVAALAQGQQPILNDALSYLDQVKVRFVDQPDVYNRFLDIMKDFKSQAIDTPGVIQRVSTLFNGHPALIQGFNTFLPPGYRIECGTEDNPDAIRVTTPSGTNTISMPQRAPLDSAEMGPSGGMVPHGRPEFFDQSRPGWQQQPQHQQQQQQPGNLPGSYSPGSRMMGAGLFGQQGGQGQPREHHYDYPPQQEQQAPGPAPSIPHGPDQRGVSQLQGAASAASNALGRSSMMQVSPAGQNPNLNQPMNSLAGVGSGMLQGAQADLNKRGPVEFNHAISYVNKIKNRFASAPEIYKQFLEILQTYQRESKPIQDVYAQVTQLFNTAPDLLEDFKQFLPESAAHAKQQAAAARQAEEAAPISNVRGEPSYPNGNSTLASQTPSRDVKMPPLGQFNVKDSGKENKKRRGGPGAPSALGSSISGPSAGADAARMVDAQGRPPALQPGSSNKVGLFINTETSTYILMPLQRAKVHHGKPSQSEIPAVSPTLIPALPEPIPPTLSLTPTQEEFAFFDRVKKYIGNKQTFNEFLKLCNLYSTDLIDRHVLVKRAGGYIGSNPELMAWFKRFMHVDEPEDKIIESKPQHEPGVVNLSHCRSLGPSYRLLPKRERQKPCSGRDQLCYNVLNDEWASHPTWASEDSGFVAHRKNQFEDALHRIEEDRHDYDHHIEACTRTIQLIEPIVQQFLIMPDAERAAFKLPPGLGGQSEAIYQRVIKKIYDRQRGDRIIREMFERPCHVLPIVLFRLKQKCEEWKASQREWDKIWREQMQKAYWRSLDHQAIASKGSDKKLFVAKHIQNEVQNKFEESKNLRKSGFQTYKHQFEFTYDDPAVLIDATHLLLTFIDRNSTGTGADHQKVMSFIKDFIPYFFGMDRDTFHVYMNELSSGTSQADDDESLGAEEASTPRSRKGLTGKKMDLLRDVLERRSEKAHRTDKEGSTPGSCDGTPDAVLVPSTPVPDPTEPFDVAELKWMEHPGQGNFNLQREYTLNETYEKKCHHLYANLSIYCFFRTFEILYSRLLRIKLHEKDAHEDVRRALVNKPAQDLGLIDKVPTDFFTDCSPKANLYQQIVRMCEEVIKGDLETSHLEETLRRYYLRSGYQLYNLEKMFTGISKFAGAIFNGDSKDRSSDIINLFFKERDKEETTHNQEIQYRKQVERLVKDGDIYRVSYYPTNKKTTVQLLTPEDATLENEELSQEARWSYYVSAYTMRDPTEGVPFTQMRMPFLHRNLPPKLEQEEEYNRYYRPLVHQDGLIIRICANSYHILYEPGSFDWWWRPTASPDESTEEIAKEEAAVKERRRDRFTEKFINNPSWAHGLSKDQVDESNQRFRSWIKGSASEIGATAAPEATTSEHAGEEGDEKEDTEMADAEPAPSESKEEE
ncbi:Transcriptional regulatory protein sin3 [Aspergillus nanangensis]|uniref:Transcriptional regulatory protein sin3 n=1 Tax=Aspergillus nanangensis TaxID=2582783 RepID=A0AAD4CY18_ASPNN|nr:Transcriptional regulatory protein sin3 [Aspergillus nanangensis]